MTKRDKNMTSRRQFLKKTAYSTPTLLILGQLLAPTSSFGGGDSTVGPINSTQVNKRIKH